MKKLLVLLLITAFILGGCANNVVSMPSQATADQATQDQATPDQTSDQPVSPAFRDLTSPTKVSDDQIPSSPSGEKDAAALSKYNRILNGELRDDSSELDVEAMDQYPELPSGCESVALTIALNGMGAELDKTDIAEKYLEYDDNFAVGFCGDPFTDGGAGVYPPGLVSTAWNYINDKNAGLYAFDTTGLTIEELCKFIDAGCPAVVWTTVYMGWPYFDGGVEYNEVFYPWYDLEHCVCMYGYDVEDNEVMISDPQRGKITVSMSEFEEIYDEIGRFSMILMDVSDL